MGHIMLKTILRARDALAALTVERDGVDGRSIYLYGEGWDYAEVERNRVGKNASQLNLAGTGVGSFNDRLREGIMGGSPFGDPRVQGVLTGLYFAPNGFIDQGTADNQRNRVMEDCEKVIAAMAGNLKEYRFVNRKGFSTPGKDAAWVGSNVGYAAEPRETVNYVSAHDNETLFDGIMLRSAPDVPVAVRCRLNRIAVAVVAFSQGVPFFHAGDEILRSKSLDRDSYNSGDWFNRLDYTGETHNFGIGLPGRDKNGDRYGYIGHLLGDLSLRPGRDEIARSDAHMRECLAIRRSSPLFRLRTAARSIVAASSAFSFASRSPPAASRRRSIALVVAFFASSSSSVNAEPGAVDGGSFGLSPPGSMGSKAPSSLPSQPSFQPSLAAATASVPDSTPAPPRPTSPTMALFSAASASATRSRAISSFAASSMALLAPSSVFLARSAASALATAASSASLRFVSSLPISFSSSDRSRSVSSDSAIFSLRCAAMTSAMSPSSYHLSFLALDTGSFTY